MKTVILAGGLGTRLSEETTIRPKPMVEIGDRPILIHIMEIYARHGFRDFIVALGYKGDAVKSYFLDYRRTLGDIDIDLASGNITYANSKHSDWHVQLIDTGLNSMTGGRLRRLAPLLRDGGTFMVTYGDGVSNVDIKELVEFHRAHGKLMTLTAVRPPARFGAIEMEGSRIVEFREKPQASEGWINGGFIVCEPGVFDYLDGDQTVLETTPLQRLAADGQLMAFRHDGFWMCMDTLRDKFALNALWDSGQPPWIARQIR